MTLSELIRKLTKLQSKYGTNSVGICDRNVQESIPIRDVDFIPEQGTVIIFAEDEP